MTYYASNMVSVKFFIYYNHPLLTRFFLCLIFDTMFIFFLFRLMIRKISLCINMQIAVI